MTEHQALTKLIKEWHVTRRWAESFICEHLNLASAEDILQPENRGRELIANTGWYYCTHGIGVDIYKEGNRGGIDFDFGVDTLDSYKLRDFMIKQLNAGNLTKKHYRRLLQDTKLWQSTFESVYTET